MEGGVGVFVGVLRRECRLVVVEVVLLLLRFRVWGVFVSVVVRSDLGSEGRRGGFCGGRGEGNPGPSCLRVGDVLMRI